MWEVVIESSVSAAENRERPPVRRLRVVGGWLYQVLDAGSLWSAPTFVPDPIEYVPAIRLAASEHMAGVHGVRTLIVSVERPDGEWAPVIVVPRDDLCAKGCRSFISHTAASSVVAHELGSCR